VTKTRNYAESRLQAEAVKELSLLGVYVMQIPNGEIANMSKKKFARLVAMGFRKGAWDTLLLERNKNRFFGLEFKQPGEEQLPSQKAFEQVCIANNWPYKIAETVEQAIESAKEWGLIKGI